MLYASACLSSIFIRYFDNSNSTHFRRMLSQTTQSDQTRPVSAKRNLSTAGMPNIIFQPVGWTLSGLHGWPATLSLAWLGQLWVCLAQARPTRAAQASHGAPIRQQQRQPKRAQNSQEVQKLRKAPKAPKAPKVPKVSLDNVLASRASHGYAIGP